MSCGDAQPHEIEVSDVHPVADFTASCADLTCSFTDESTDPDGSVVAWRWSFGDGAESTLADPSHLYDAAGPYTVALTVTDDTGRTGRVSREIVVQDSPVPVVTLGTTEIVIDADGPGANVDMMAFWEAPDPTEAVMFVSSKDSPLVERWRYPFSTEDATASLQHPCISDGTNGVLVDQDQARLYVTVRFEPSVCVFGLPDLDFVMEITTSGTSGNSEPNLALLKVATGHRRLYVSYDVVVHVYDADTGTEVGSFVPDHGLENMAADPVHQRLYIPDESDRSGVYVYDPDGNFLAVLGTDLFQSDAEGITLFSCPADGASDDGSGFIVVSDQLEPLTDFHVFDRETFDHVATVRIDGVNNTDGIASTQQSSPAYPTGLFAAIDDDFRTVAVEWSTIFGGMGLACPD